MQKIIVVCGPTSTGKSDRAVDIALEINGEIISADSRQVYKGLDIGSGKITKNEMKGVPHHLLDVVDAKNVFSVVDYKRLTEVVIKDIISRGKTPIICGGTGFYIDAIICDIVFPSVSPNLILRKELGAYSLEELQHKLQTLDSKRFDLIDKKNKVRLIRAIEIAIELGSVPELKKINNYDIKWVYLDFPDDILKNRIHDRLMKRLSAGMVEEVEVLHKEGLSWERLESLGLEYKYLAQYLQNKISKEQMITYIEKESWQYVKRQRTWFKKYAKTPPIVF